MAIDSVDPGSARLPIPIKISKLGAVTEPANSRDVRTPVSDDVIIQDGVRMVRVDSWGYRPERLQEVDFPPLITVKDPDQQKVTGGSNTIDAGMPGTPVRGATSSTSEPVINVKDYPGVSNLRPISMNTRPPEKGVSSSRRGKELVDDGRSTPVSKGSPTGEFTLPRNFRKGKEQRVDTHRDPTRTNIFNTLRDLEEKEQALNPPEEVGTKSEGEQDRNEVQGTAKRQSNLQDSPKISDSQTSAGLETPRAQKEKAENSVLTWAASYPDHPMTEEDPTYQKVETFSQLVPVGQGGVMEEDIEVEDPQEVARAEEPPDRGEPTTTHTENVLEGVALQEPLGGGGGGTISDSG
ncbi:hypothetical protein R1sor_016994 [Riccia sorocarpa]|uniref:Uncharacterized protein n=1 Tax=Riccia sorocarpa TaxID=122646 RepID=A0ABD3I5H6_9MARC